MPKYKFNFAQITITPYTHITDIGVSRLIDTACIVSQWRQINRVNGNNRSWHDEYHSDYIVYRIKETFNLQSFTQQLSFTDEYEYE